MPITKEHIEKKIFSLEMRLKTNIYFHRTFQEKKDMNQEIQTAMIICDIIDYLEGLKKHITRYE